MKNDEKQPVEMKKDEKYVGVAFRLTETTRTKLRGRARDNGVTTSTFLRLVVEEAMTRDIQVETAVLLFK